MGEKFEVQKINTSINQCSAFVQLMEKELKNCQDTLETISFSMISNGGRFC